MGRREVRPSMEPSGTKVYRLGRKGTTSIGKIFYFSFTFILEFT